MRTRKRVNETKVIAAYICVNSLINIVLVLINAFFIQNDFISKFLLGYNICLLVTAIIQAIVVHANTKLAMKDADQKYLMLSNEYLKAQEKVKENQKEGK